MKKHIDKVTWVISGASAAIMVISIYKKDPLLYAIAFIMALGCVFGYYMFKSPEEVVDICENEQYIQDEHILYQDDDVTIGSSGELYVEPVQLTNSEITAACIKAGITDLQDIAWITKRESDEDNSPESINDSIQYLLTVRNQYK